MHERIRVADPDFADVALGIIQFDAHQDGKRSLVLRTDDGVELHGFDVLDRMVRETYELWWEICEQHAAEARGKGTGTGGLFGDAA